MARRKRVLWFKFRDAARRTWSVYLVRKVKHDGRSYQGITHFDRRIVLIEYSNDHAEMCRTAIHELCHAAGGGVSPVHGEHDLVFAAEEITIRRIEKGLWEALTSVGFALPEIPDEASLLAA